jgi:hypothetical protein
MVRERVYIWSRSTIIEYNIEDNILNELVLRDPIFDINIYLLIPLLTVPAAPARSLQLTRNTINWSYLLSNSENKKKDLLNNNPDFAFI